MTSVGYNIVPEGFMKVPWPVWVSVVVQVTRCEWVYPNYRVPPNGALENGSPWHAAVGS